MRSLFAEWDTLALLVGPVAGLIGLAVAYPVTLLIMIGLALCAVLASRERRAHRRRTTV